MHPATPKSVWAGVVVLVAASLWSLPTRVLASSDAEKRGQEVFAKHGCWQCHGQNGVGGGKGPDLQLVRKRRTHDSMVSQIHDGGKQMPAFGEVLSSEEIEDVVSFLRAKRKVIVVTPQTQYPSNQSTGKSETN